MKTLSFCTALLLNFTLALSAHALGLEHFTGSEYAFGANEPTHLKMAPKSLAGEREGFYDFINFEPGNKEKLVTYLDTPDRQLNKHSLIIRVREDLKKPSKSKITVKLRAPSPEHFGELKKYKKAEIDIVNGQKKYSVSYDIKYDPNDIDIRHVNAEVVFAKIKKKSPDAWALLAPLVQQVEGKIQQTIVMRALSWEGLVTEVPGNVECDVAIWSPYYRRPKTFITSLSFKGKTSDANLKIVAERIKSALQEKGILSDSTRSKTKATFKMSPNFK